jgi:H+-transporting ATPase
VATLIAVYGLFMTPLGWKWAGFVWAYALLWFLVTDPVKLLAYRIFDPVKAETKPGSKIEDKPETKDESQPDAKDKSKPEAKPEATVEQKPDTKAEPKPEANAKTPTDLTP